MNVIHGATEREVVACRYRRAGNHSIHHFAVVRGHDVSFNTHSSFVDGPEHVLVAAAKLLDAAESNLGLEGIFVAFVDEATAFVAIVIYAIAAVAAIVLLGRPPGHREPAVEEDLLAA